MSFLPINDTPPASDPDAHAVRARPDDHEQRLARQVRYRALARDELAYARDARALGGAHADHGVPNGVRRARTYWRMMLSERRRAQAFSTYAAGAARRDADLRDVGPPPSPWDDLPAAGEIIAALRHGPMRTFALDTAVVIEGHALSGRVVLRMTEKVWSLTTLDAAVIAILLRLQPDLRIAPLVADALTLGARQAEAKVEAVHRWSAVIQPVDGDEA